MQSIDTTYNTWTHIVATIDRTSNSANIYVNGVLLATSTPVVILELLREQCRGLVVLIGQETLT